MTSPVYTARTKEYPTANGMLIIKNIAKEDRKKADVIRDILENFSYPGREILIQSTCRNSVDCGTQEKEVSI